MNKRLIIIGAGPRGLGVALRAIREGIRPIVIDPQPLKTWTPPNILIDMNMRSPIGFDLVSFCPELKEFSLSFYLGSYNDIQQQREIEIQQQPITRQTFLNYLNYVWSYIQGEVDYIADSIISVGKDYVILKKEKLITDFIVLALGPISSLNMPQYARPFLMSDRLLNPKELVTDVPIGKTIGVIGSGQSAAEYVDYLTPRNKVIWVINKELRVDPYPVPSYRLWGEKTGLGDYYRRLQKTDKEYALRYLKQVRQWGPSITKGVADSLESKGEVIKKVSNQEVLKELGTIDSLLLCTGFNPSIENIPLAFKVDRERSSINYPEIVSNFRIKEGIYFTGELAKYYDGPRQGSLISIGLTSKEIVEDILKRDKEE